MTAPTQLSIIAGGKARPRSPRPRPTQATWTPYTAARPAKCGDCLLELAHDPEKPAARLARRRLRAAGVDVLVCYEHAAARGDTQLRRRQRGAG